VTIESQIARRSARTVRCSARRLPPDLNIARPIRPANDTAPATAISTIRIDRDCFAEDESAAARETVAAANGGGAGCELDGAVALEVSTAAAGLADESTPDKAGQREATTDDSAFASGGVENGLFAGLATLAGAAGTGRASAASVQRGHPRLNSASAVLLSAAPAWPRVEKASHPPAAGTSSAGCLDARCGNANGCPRASGPLVRKDNRPPRLLS
jgi:hypothetical protein